MNDKLPSAAQALEEAARTIGHVYSLEDTLAVIVATAQHAIPGIDHAGISTIDRHGVATTRAATDDLVRHLDKLQYTLNEGPCVDTLRHEHVVTAPDIRHDQRWPRYVPAAVRETPLKAQLAVQLYLDEDSAVGGLNLCAIERADLDPDAESIARLFAAHAAAALGKAHEITGLSAALETRTTIGKAVGILMERYQMNEDRAFGYLTRAASHANIKVRDVAQEVVDKANQR